MPITSQNEFSLDAYLDAVNAPISLTPPVTPGYQFNTANETNAVVNTNIRNIAASKISAGSITVAINLGSATTGSVVLDGANNRILINDGTVDRILIGFQSGGF